MRENSKLQNPQHQGSSKVKTPNNQTSTTHTGAPLSFGARGFGFRWGLEFVIWSFSHPLTTAMTDLRFLMSDPSLRIENWLIGGVDDPNRFSMTQFSILNSQFSIPLSP